jgi:uncharacterized repeat protein (TIGR03837 family)
MDSPPDLDILCKVVDNFGDIGVVYRLAKSLSQLPEAPRIRLIVDKLDAFAALAPSVHVKASFQTVYGWDIYPWSGAGVAEARRAFTLRPARIIIECFACGRPDWLEELIFDPQAEASLIVDLEHLTAEAYAEEFHRLPSLTRSSTVRKAMFFPGFSPKTGGLLMDRDFLLSLERAGSDPGRTGLRRELLAGLPAPLEEVAEPDRGARPALEERFWISVFGYERDYGRAVADLAAFGRERPLLALAAAGKSQACFRGAWEEAGRPFPLLGLPFLPQETWDSLVAACDFSIVRGEDSWSRAALSGRPFLWQAYPQEGRHQLVKVQAFLDRLRPYVAAPGGTGGAFPALEALYLAFNDRESDGSGERGGERLLPVLEAYSEILPGFRAFSASLAGNPDLAVNLVTFLHEIV